MRSRSRGVARWTLVGVLFVSVAGCAPDATSQAIASFDPEEVQMLRDNAKDEGIDVDNALLLSTLRFREECRVIGSGLADLASGVDASQVADDLGRVTQIARDDGQDEMADTYVAMIDEVRLGDSSRLQEFHAGSCADVQ